MPKYRVTHCQDDRLTKGMWAFSPIDLRRKYYKCSHCGNEHLVKKSVTISPSPGKCLKEKEP